MTAVIRAADAPRAASSISSSSIRCSCTGGTSGWMMNTSASRQLASKLHAQAVVAETADRRRAERRLQPFADIARERLVRTSAEDHDPVHGPIIRVGRIRRR